MRATPGAPKVVAIDGPAGSGKSSVSRALARRLGFVRLDSGALYRAVTARVIAAGLDPEDPEVGALARSLHLSVDVDGGVRLDGARLPDELLRGAPVSALVSRVSALPAVREALLRVQRDAAAGAAGLVAEGRDMGSVVFPDAGLRVYLDARPEVRAARRLAQEAGEGRTTEDVAAALAARDARDSGRAVAPLVQADGAIVLDTSEMSLEEVVEALVTLVAEGPAQA